MIGRDYDNSSAPPPSNPPQKYAPSGKTKKSKKCWKCSVPFAASSTVISCGFCDKTLHIECVNNFKTPLTPQEVQKNNLNANSLFYMCENCQTEKKKLTPAQILNVEERLETTEKKALADKDTFRKQYNKLEAEINVHKAALDLANRKAQQYDHLQTEYAQMQKHYTESQENQRKLSEKVREHQKVIQEFDSLKAEFAALKQHQASTSNPSKRKHLDVSTELKEFGDQDIGSITELIEKQGNVFAKVLADSEAKYRELMDKQTAYIEQIAAEHSQSHHKLTAELNKIANDIKGNQTVPHNTSASPVKVSPIKQSVRNANTVNELEDLSGITYAEAVARSKTTSNCIKNVTVLGDDNNSDLVANLIRTENVCVGLPVLSIVEKGKKNITIKCADPKTAETIEDQLVEKYGDRIKVTSANPQLPEIKIVRVFVDIKEDDNIIDLIKYHNVALRHLDIKLVRVYKIKTSSLEYNNIIISCSLADHKLLLSKGYIIMGMSQCRLYENVNTLQCLRCLHYGHFARTCQSQPKCKYCAGPHDHNNCAATTPVCANCVEFNEKGGTYDTKHIASDDRCNVRKNRIEGLKQFFCRN